MKRETILIMKQNNIIIKNQILLMKSLISLMSGHVNDSNIFDLMVKVDKLDNAIVEISESLK